MHEIDLYRLKEPPSLAWHLFTYDIEGNVIVGYAASASLTANHEGLVGRVDSSVDAVMKLGST